MVKVCVVGCLHGELDKIYKDVLDYEEQNSFKTDIILCCGDFQAVRNPFDLNSMSVPQKYFKIGDFYKYYSGAKVAPRLTVFVGGNHEASSYMQELAYGGWVAKNIYFMGYASVIQFKGIRIAGISGIYKNHDYNLGHCEAFPYNENTKRSVYHTRNLEVFRLNQIRRRIDVVISHDWPRGIYHYGNCKRLCQKKKHFVDEINQNILGSPAHEQLLCYLQPRYWFAAHLHCKFSAIVQHSEDKDAVTKFLALNRPTSLEYIQFLDIEPDHRVQYMKPYSEWNLKKHPSDPIIVETSEEGVGLSLDPEWLTILQQTNEFLSISRVSCILPDGSNGEKYDYSADDDKIADLYDLFGGEFSIPDNFEPTAPPFDPTMHLDNYVDGQKINPNKLVELSKDKSFIGDKVVYVNPQTELICAMLTLSDPNAMLKGCSSYNLGELTKKLLVPEKEEVLAEDEEEEYEPQTVYQDPDLSSIEYRPAAESKIVLEPEENPEEIIIEDVD